MNNDRHYSFADQIILQLQAGLETIIGKPNCHRVNPAENHHEPLLTRAEKKQSAGLMRVNHSGEVCAQALYRGQQMMAHTTTIHEMLATAAHEETDHLVWCQQRLEQLGSHRSYLNAFWYSNAFLIGMLAGYMGDAWSLGFVDETEKQVEAHLAGHLQRLPAADDKSRCIVDQMKSDEMRHGSNARNSGAKELPATIKKIMLLHAKVMTTLAYWI
jgi:ubiquinone biosynthesis monooxygenase Coq7